MVQISLLNNLDSMLDAQLPGVDITPVPEKEACQVVTDSLNSDGNRNVGLIQERNTMVEESILVSFH